MFEGRRGAARRARRPRARLADPAVHADRVLARRLGQRYAELGPVVRAYARVAASSGTTSRPARELAGEDAVLRRGGRRARAAQREAAEERLRRLLVPRDPTDAKDAILEIKSGEGGEESALFAGDLLRMYTRYAERRGWRIEVLDATESDLGGLQVRDGGGEGEGRPRARRGAVRAAQVRGRGPPGAAGAGHRVAGARPHLRRRGAGDARGRAGRRRASTRTTCGSTSSAPRARAGRASTRPTPRCGSPTCHRASSSAARTRSPSCRTGSRRCASCAPGCSPPARRRPTRPRPATPAAPRCAPSTGPSASAPTTSRRTASPTTAPATRRTTSTRCSTATSARSSSPASRRTSPRGWPRWRS